MPALPPYIIEPIWEQFRALLPERGDDDHPLGCHRARICDRAIFEKLVQILVFGCAYWRSPTSRAQSPHCAVGETSGLPPE
jgi:transposase